MREAVARQYDAETVTNKAATKQQAFFRMNVYIFD
jgi:hypothetical protein